MLAVLASRAATAPEPIEGTVFPPEQVFSKGFVCRQGGQRKDRTAAGIPASDDESALTVDARLAAVEAGLGTLQAAVAGLHARVAELEGSR